MLGTEASDSSGLEPTENWLVLKLRIPVVLNQQKIVGVVQLIAEGRSKVAYLRIHRGRDSRPRSDRTPT